MEYFDNIGNQIRIGDEVLVLVPKSDASYRKGIVKDFRNGFEGHGKFYCEVLVEYEDGRLYCNKKHFYQRQGDDLVFSKKFIKAWRHNSDIILYKENILNKYIKS